MKRTGGEDILRRLGALYPLVALLATVVHFASARGDAPAERALPSVQAMIDARTDVWGDAARAAPNGASYEFFKDLLPPLRWVNTDFRHYPIVLSAPRAPHKARLVSNGSAVNARANKPPMWYEQGVPVSFYVGDGAEPFGADLARLSEPAYLNGYLPIVALDYEHGGAAYKQEAFAPVDGRSAAHGAVRLRFSMTRGEGRIAARLGAAASLKAQDGLLLNEEGQCVLAFGSAWQWNSERQALVTELQPGRAADIAVFTKPIDPDAMREQDDFDAAREACIRQWQELLDKCVSLETPEPIVNDAWRATLIGVHMAAVGNRLHYSAGNAYAKLYEGECGDILRAMTFYGHLDEAPAMLKPLLEYQRQDTRFHVAGHKLQLLAWFYWVTRDADSVRKYEPLWRPSVDLILNSRESGTGLLPKDNYAGDVKDQVYSLNSNAACWRGLRDVAVVLEDMGSKDEAARLPAVAAEYRKAILAAVERSEVRDARPPFIPIALLANEPAHDPLTATRQGSYYDLMAPYVIGSEIFGQGSEREDWLIGYLQNHGGISMGMIRTMPHVGQFKGEPGVNPLYGVRYQLALLRRDDRERAIVGFYGQLAQGMTRGTFIGGEGSRFRHGDARGRSFYLPPNAASNAAWLLSLRYLLVQDWDLDQDARPETLRLLFAAPRRWLLDGRRIRVENAPTCFGPVSCRAESRLESGYIDVRVAPPPRPAKTMLLRAPVPEGWAVESATIDGAAAALVGGDTVDLSGRTQPMAVRIAVKRVREQP